MNSLQRASRNRKIVYFVVIAALFTLSMVWRGLIDVPLGTSPARIAQPFRWAQAHTIQSQAQRLEVWESNPAEGEADVSGSAIRLLMLGSRGVAVTILWMSAIEKQKRGDFHEFEDRIQRVTQLQPNFITPWIFQSWNITYNVSVEMHGSGDMYFYIVRGIQLLAEGERRNRRSPDMRYWIAFYYWNKFGVSDQVETLRCLFDLSCITPQERHPDNFYKPDRFNPTVKVFDHDRFRAFCERHPHLVRRLRGETGTFVRADEAKRQREKLRNETPEKIVQFLRDNYEVPGRHKSAGDGELKDASDRELFPVLPPQFDTGRAEQIEAHPGLPATDDAAPNIGYFSAYKAARAWAAYSLLLLPPPVRDDQGRPIPAPTPRPGDFGHDPAKHRVPRQPTMILFRQAAPRAQSFQAEMEQKEGWFDNEGWRIDDPASGAGAWWFPAHTLPTDAAPELRKAGVPELVVKKLADARLVGATHFPEVWDEELYRVLGPDDASRYRGAVLGATTVHPRGVVVGTQRDWSLEEWKRAADMWARHGESYGLSLGARYESLLRLAGDVNAMPAELTPEQMADDALRRRYLATLAVRYYYSQRATTNFPYYLHSAEAEARVVGGVPLTVLARKTLWKADQARKNGNKDRAIELYKEGLQQWKRVLLENPTFHRLPPPDHSDRVEEETYEYELAYLRLLVTTFDPRVTERANRIAHAAHAVVPFLTDPFPPGGAVTPQWPSANREEIRWYIVENVAGADFSSPFVGTTTARGEQWVSEFVKEAVRVKQGVVRRRPAEPAGPMIGPDGRPIPGGPPGAPPGGSGQ